MRRVFLTLLLAGLTATPAFAGSAASADEQIPISLRVVPDTPLRATPGEAPDLSHLQAGMSTGGASVGKAVAYSLLLPGLGDYLLGHRTRAAGFFIAEAAIWTSFGVFKTQGRLREDSYQEYAVQFAGVTRTGHSDDFYAELRDWDSSDEYEAAIKSEGRLDMRPDAGQAVLEQYYLENRVADFEAWEWQTIYHKVQFQKMRSSSKTAYRRGDFAIAAAIANRIVSALFAYSAARSANAELSQQRYRIQFTPPARYAREYDAAVTITRSF